MDINIRLEKGGKTQPNPHKCTKKKKKTCHSNLRNKKQHMAQTIEKVTHFLAIKFIMS